VNSLSKTQIFNLLSEDGAWRAQVSPVGGSLVSLWRADVEIVASPYGQPLAAFAGALMAPWPNRLEDGTWKLGNREFVAPINDLDGNNANHGLVFDKIFEIVHHSEKTLRLETEIFDERAYPFQVLLTITYALDSNGLHISLEAKNLTTEAVAFAFGLHPYFVAEEDSELELNAQTWIQKNSRNLPTHSLPIDSSSPARSGLNTVAQLNIDDCFTNLVANEQGLYSTKISRPSVDLVVDILQSRTLSHVMLFKFQELENQKRILLAVEPQTASANFLRNFGSESLLRPNQVIEANFQIRARKK
jgi:aldose 1-epimerase